MLVGKQMLLAVFIIAIAFGTEPEFQIRPVPFRPAANGAFMPCNILRLPHPSKEDVIAHQHHRQKNKEKLSAGEEHGGTPPFVVANFISFASD